MFRHRNCVTDPEVKGLWREYQKAVSEGNPLGFSFAEFIAVRVASRLPQGETAPDDDAYFYVAACGHSHPWGTSCSSWTAVQ